MKDFKRGIYQLEWENKKADMEVGNAHNGIGLERRICSLQVPLPVGT